MDAKSPTPEKGKETPPPRGDGHVLLGYLMAGLLGLIIIQRLWATIAPSETIP